MDGDFTWEEDAGDWGVDVSSSVMEESTRRSEAGWKSVGALRGAAAFNALSEVVEHEECEAIAREIARVRLGFWV
jgi:hypothetical protein